MSCNKVAYRRELPLPRDKKATKKSHAFNSRITCLATCEIQAFSKNITPSAKLLVKDMAESQVFTIISDRKQRYISLPSTL